MGLRVTSVPCRYQGIQYKGNFNFTTKKYTITRQGKILASGSIEEYNQHTGNLIDFIRYTLWRNK